MNKSQRVLVGVAISMLPQLAATPTATATCDANASARAICAVDAALTEALRRNDADALLKIYADDFQLINYRGRRIDRAAVLAAIKSGALRFESLNTSQLELRLFGNTGIITGVQHQVAREPGGDGAAHPQEVRFTHVYVLRERQWRLVSSQITPMLK